MEYIPIDECLAEWEALNITILTRPDTNIIAPEHICARGRREQSSICFVSYVFVMFNYLFLTCQ